MADEVTIGELSRSLADFRQSVSERFDRMDRRMDALSYVRIDVYERDRAASEARQSALEESLRWLRRTVIAAVIAGVVPILIAAILIQGGGGG